MTDDRPSQFRRFEASRRSTLRAIAGVSVGGVLASGAAATAGAAAGSFTVEQGEQRYEVEPLSGTTPVRQLYDLRIPDEYGGDNGATDTQSEPYYMSAGTRDLQRESTTLTFLYDGPDGLSLVVVHDTPGGDGGSATWTVAGSLDGTEWLVKDDLYTDPGTGEPIDSNFDNWRTAGTPHEIDWTWSDGAGDGGVLGYLSDGFELTITPAFNELAALYGKHYSGTIDRWQFLSGDLTDPDRYSLALDGHVRIRHDDGESTTDGTEEEETEETADDEEVEADDEETDADETDDDDDEENEEDDEEEDEDEDDDDDEDKIERGKGKRRGKGKGKGRDKGKGKGRDKGKGKGRDKGKGKGNGRGK